MSSRGASRVFVEESPESGAEMALPDEQSHYVSRVLRLKPGDGLTIFDGHGGEFAAVVARTGQRTFLRVGEHVVVDRESPLSVHLAQGLCRGERMDVAVQKATELGVRRITPLLTEFSVVKLDAKRRDKRVAHWTRIARSACEQCGRNTVPAIAEPRRLDEWLGEPPADGRLRIVLHPGASGSIATLEPPRAGVDLLIGPEGGISDREREAAVAAGFIACGFGPRTLRAETAALAALAVLQALWGDLARAGGGSG